MRKIIFALLTAIVGVIVLTPALGWVKNEDINRDGVKEKIVWQEKRREIYYLASMTVSRKDKVVFQVKDLLTTGMNESAVKIVDIDPRFPGSEIIVIIPSDMGLIEDGRCIDEQSYRSTIHRWDSSGRFVSYWVIKTPYQQRTISQVVKDVKNEYPKFMKAQKTAQSFVRAIADGKWGKVQSMMQEDKSWIKVSAYQEMQKDCKSFPPSKTWEMFASPHERNNICFIAWKSKTQAFTIIVTPQGVEMGRGDNWD